MARRASACSAAQVATAASPATHERTTSPKSMTPQGTRRPLRSRRATTFHSVTSPWMTPRRSAGPRRSRVAPKRSAARSTCAWRAGSRTSPSSAATTSAACCRSHSRSRPAAGWSKSARPTAIVAAAAPMPSSSASGRWCWSATGSPSIQLTSRTSNVSPPRSTGTSSRPSRAGSGTGVSSARPFAARWCIAAFCSTSESRPKPGLAILRIVREPPSSSRTFWSCCEPSSRGVPPTPKCSCAIATASSCANAGLRSARPAKGLLVAIARDDSGPAASSGRRARRRGR